MWVGPVLLVTFLAGVVLMAVYLWRRRVLDARLTVI